MRIHVTDADDRLKGHLHEWIYRLNEDATHMGRRAATGSPTGSVLTATRMPVPARDRLRCGAIPIFTRAAVSDELLSQSVDLEFIPLDGDAAATQRPDLGQGDEGCA